jgi:hypothetical protein
MAYIRELNLLPPARRSFLAQQVVLNAIVRFLHSLNVGLGIMTGMGLVAIVVLQLLVTFLSGSTTVLLAGEVKHYQDLRSQVAKQNQSLAQMVTLSTNQIVWSNLLPDLLGTMAPGTHVQQIAGTETTATTLVFSGQASSRSALVVLQDRLGHLPWVQSVVAPDSNLLEPVNPNYTFTLTLNPPVAAPAVPSPTVTPTVSPSP